jgi:hypothetical protein
MLRDEIYEAGLECQRRLELANLARLRLSGRYRRHDSVARLGVWLGRKLIAAGEALYNRSQHETLRPREALLNVRSQANR